MSTSENLQREQERRKRELEEKFRAGAISEQERARQAAEDAAYFQRQNASRNGGGL